MRSQGQIPGKVMEKQEDPIHEKGFGIL
jgi:hypothetical protein